MNRIKDQQKSEVQALEEVESGIRSSATVDVGIEGIDSGMFNRPSSVPPTSIALATIGLEEKDFRGESALHRIVTPEFRIGRHPECNLVLHEDPKVSRRHACIKRMGEECSITDNASVNGTYVNGKRLTEVTLLRPGDKIRIGAREFTFVQRAPGTTDISSA